MSLTNAGFDGTVTELPFAYMWGVGAGGDAVESAAAWAVTQGTGRQVSVAAQGGYAFGHGVLSKDSGAILQALSTPVAGGWFLICRHIDWTTNTVSVVALTGPTSSTTVPTTAPADYSGVSGMATSPGVTYDQPLAWAWVRNTDTTMALFDLRTLPLASRIFSLENPVGEPADLTALAALAPANGTFKTVIEGGARFERVSGAWVQLTPARFATTAARDTAYAKASGAYLVQGAKAYCADVNAVTAYFGLYNSSTNPTGVGTAGWVQEGKLIGFAKHASAALTGLVSGSESTLPTLDTTDIALNGFTESAGVFTYTGPAGYFLVGGEVELGAAGTSNFMTMKVYKNGTTTQIAFGEGPANASQFAFARISQIVKLVPGDTIRWRITPTGATTVSQVTISATLVGR